MKKFFGFFNPFFLCVLDKGYNSTEGRAQGLVEGAKKQIIEDAKSFYANGASIELIANSLKITLDEVKEIVKDTSIKH